MARRPRRSHVPSPAKLVSAFAAFAVGAFVASAALAQSAPELVKSDFPDRRWSPVTAADAGLAGSGLATDPASSAYANPALWLGATYDFRVAGGFLNPNRDDLRASTLEFQEADGFLLLGEGAVRFKSKGLGFGLYFSQPHYEHGETRFIGFNPETGGGGDPFPRDNEFTAATRYAGGGAAMRLGQGIVIGAGLEAVLTKESYSSIPDVPAGSGLADTAEVALDGSAMGGVVGVLVPVGKTWSIGGSYRLGGEITYDDGGTDEAPALGILGVRYGWSAGSAGYAGVRFLGERVVDLGAAAGTGEATSPSRTEYALGYAYLAPEGGWAVRIGGALSPAPDDDSNRFTRFGVSLGMGGEGLRASLAYTREAETRPDDRNSSRNMVLATVELGN